MILDKLNIAIIDDEEFYHHIMETELEKYGLNLDFFLDYAPFFEIIEREPSRYNFVIVDRFIGNQDSIANKFVDSCHYYGYSNPIMLNSNIVSQEDREKNSSKFDYIFSKGDFVDWKSIISRLSE